MLCCSIQYNEIVFLNYSYFICCANNNIVAFMLYSRHKIFFFFLGILTLFIVYVCSNIINISFMRARSKNQNSIFHPNFICFRSYERLSEFVHPIKCLNLCLIAAPFQLMLAEQYFFIGIMIALRWGMEESFFLFSDFLYIFGDHKHK